MENIPIQKKRNWKLWIIVLSGVIFFGTGLYAYLWIAEMYERDMRAQQIFSQAEQYRALIGAVDREYYRCQEFIIQREGDFGSFEYCKKFIEWTNHQRNMLLD